MTDLQNLTWLQDQLLISEFREWVKESGAIPPSYKLMERVEERLSKLETLTKRQSKIANWVKDFRSSRQQSEAEAA